MQEVLPVDELLVWRLQEFVELLQHRDNPSNLLLTTQTSLLLALPVTLLSSVDSFYLINDGL